MTIVSRIELDHPALGTPGGSALHTSIEAIYVKLGNNMADRFFYIQNLDAAASVDCDHNFNTELNNLRYDLYSWNESTGELTFLTESTTPKRSEIALIAKVGDTLKQMTITNNSAAQVDLGLVVVHDPIEINELTDVNTAGKEDGQALVYDSATDTWKPGASGDSSFKLQSITDPNLSMKGGFIILDDGRELATFNTTYGADLTLNLDTILGSNPADATAYYLYIDLDSLGAEQTEALTGRKLYKVELANFVLMTTKPEGNLLARYLPVGIILSATTGTVWSGTGAAFRTLAYRRHDNLPVTQAPLIYGDFSKLVSSVGTSGQIKQGHVLSTKSFRAAHLDTAKLSFYNLREDSNDEYGSRNLANPNSIPYTGTNILGEANTAANLSSASAHYFSSSDAFYASLASTDDYAYGFWAKMADYTPAAIKKMLCLRSGSYGPAILINTSGTIQFDDTTDGGTTPAALTIANPSFTDNTWHHFAVIYNATLDMLYAFIDGVRVGELSVVKASGISGATLNVGRDQSGSNYVDGLIEDLFFVKGALLTDNDILKLASTRIDHNKNVLASRQKWEFNYLPLGLDPISDLSKVVIDQSDPNSMFADLSQLGATDKVDIKLFNTGLNNAVQAASFEAEYIFNASGQLTPTTTSFPTYLPEEPRAIVSTQKDSSGKVYPLDISGDIVWVTSDSQKYLQGNLDGLTTPPSSTTPVRISVACRTIANTVSDADSTTRGLISAAKQLISGLKKWLGGISSVEYVGTNPEVGGSTPFQLTDDHKRVQVINPAGAITVKLPTTGIRAGERFKIVNRSTNVITVQSSGANEIAVLYLGYIECRALVDTPTNSTDWVIESIDYVGSSYSASFSSTTHVDTLSLSDVVFHRKNKIMYMSGGLTMKINPTGTGYQFSFSMSKPVNSLTQAHLGSGGGLYGRNSDYSINGHARGDSTSTIGFVGSQYGTNGTVTYSTVPFQVMYRLD